MTGRALTIAFVVLLVTCLAQAAWWIVDQARTTNATRERAHELYEQDAAAASAWLTLGATPDEVVAHFPHLVVDGGVASVDPAARAVLDEARRRHLNRYGWEGTFFIGVLLATIALIGRTLREHGELLQRQQNFLAAVSHELKSPLASLKLSAETLLLRDPGPEDRERIADRMVQAADRLENLVTDLLDTAKLEEGRLQHAPASIDLGEAIRAVVEPAACTARVRGVEITSAIPDHSYVHADPAALSTVLRNLVSNAVKSAAANGGGAVRVGVEREGARVRVDVVDDGMGFPPDEAARLFEKFYRPGDELRRRTSGAGLGLFLARRLAELDGGRIEAASGGPGQGATFRASWDAAEAAP